LAVLLQDAPFFDSNTTATLVDGSTIVVARRQIIVWVSLSPLGFDECPLEARPFPAVLDTGFNHGLLLQPTHFQLWTGYELTLPGFQAVDRLEVYGAYATLYEADLWLRPNVRGRRDELARRPPYRLSLELGVAVSPLADKPRLPLLGMLAICRNGLKLSIDGACETR
jgi:hypothetical protein